MRCKIVDYQIQHTCMILKDRETWWDTEVDGKISSKCKTMKMLQFWPIVFIFALFSIFWFVMILTVLVWVVLVRKFLVFVGPQNSVA